MLARLFRMRFQWTLLRLGVCSARVKKKKPAERANSESIQTVDVSRETLERIARAKLKNTVQQKLSYNLQGKLSFSERVGQHISAKA